MSNSKPLASLSLDLANEWACLKTLFAVTPDSLLLHPTDFLGVDDETRMSFFPGMNLKADFKIRLLDDIMNTLSQHIEIVPLRDKVHSIRKTIRKQRSVQTAVQGVIGVGRSRATT